MYRRKEERNYNMPRRTGLPLDSVTLPTNIKRNMSFDTPLVSKTQTLPTHPIITIIIID